MTDAPALRIDQLSGGYGSGVIVRDIQMGLIDFPAVRDGQLIFLCWRRGEALRIDWWHPTNTGIAGRRPL